MSDEQVFFYVADSYLVLFIIYSVIFFMLMCAVKFRLTLQEIEVSLYEHSLVIC